MIQFWRQLQAICDDCFKDSDIWHRCVVTVLQTLTPGIDDVVSSCTNVSPPCTNVVYGSIEFESESVSLRVCDSSELGGVFESLSI